MWRDVSVPRRGFVVFLLRPSSSPLRTSLRRSSFSPPKGIRCFSTTQRPPLNYCAPDAFQSPEGDSLFFYEVLCHEHQIFSSSFSPPKGIRCFSTFAIRFEFILSAVVSVPRRGFVVFLLAPWAVDEIRFNSFSPPKGIRCFSTCPGQAGVDGSIMRGFQSPEGDSLFFYFSADCGRS